MSLKMFSRTSVTATLPMHSENDPDYQKKQRGPPKKQIEASSYILVGGVFIFFLIILYMASHHLPRTSNIRHIARVCGCKRAHHQCMHSLHLYPVTFA